MQNENKLNGLGGWLILVGIGVVLAPLRLIYVTVQVYKPLLESGDLSNITDPSSPTYIPFAGSLFFAELAVNLAIMLAGIFAIYGFFGRKRVFPRFYSGYLMFCLAFLIIDTLVSAKIFATENVLDSGTIGNIVGSTISTAIWVPYLMVSKRVKATFVN